MNDINLQNIEFRWKGNNNDIKDKPRLFSRDCNDTKRVIYDEADISETVMKSIDRLPDDNVDFDVLKGFVGTRPKTVEKARDKVNKAREEDAKLGGKRKRKTKKNKCKRKTKKNKHKRKTKNNKRKRKTKNNKKKNKQTK